MPPRTRASANLSVALRAARGNQLALLVDLVTSGWRGVEQRLARIEERLAADAGATVYRMEDRQAS